MFNRSVRQPVILSARVYDVRLFVCLFFIKIDRLSEKMDWNRV